MHTRILPSFLVLFCFSTQIFAQWSVGISGGATVSFRQWNIQPLDFDLGYDPGLAYNAALIGEWRAGQVISLRAEGGYQVWRSRLEGFTDENGNILDVTAKDDLMAFSGALLAKITPFSRFNAYLLAGPSAARIVKNRSILKGETPDNPEFPRSITHDLEERGIEPDQYFVNFGVGHALKCGAKGQLAIEARYQIGLSNLSSASTVDARISSLLLNIGYLYQL